MAVDFFFIVTKELAGASGSGRTRVGTRWAFRRGREFLSLRKGRTRWVIWSIGRCFRMLFSEVFHMRGLLAGLSLTNKRRCQSEDLNGERFETDL